MADTPSPAPRGKKHIASQSLVDRMTSGMADPDAAAKDEITDEERRVFGLPPADEDKAGKA